MRKKKKLAIVLPTHWKAFMGGSQYQVKCLLEALSADKRFEVHYLARRTDPQFVPPDYTIQKISNDGGLRRFGYFVDAVPLLSMLKEIRPDYIYQRVACAYTGISAYYARRNNVKMIWHIAHDNDVTPGKHTLGNSIRSRYIDKPIVEYGIRNADCIVAQTGLQADLLKANYARECDAIIANFHPEPTLAEKQPDRIKVVWVANLKPWKKPEYFVRLAQDLADQENVEFIMIGAKPNDSAAWLSRLLDDMSGLDNFSYLGQRSQDEVNEILSMSHIFVNTSEQEGFANTFIQAWMRQVPVVSLHVNPDGVFDDRRVGFHAGSYDMLVKHVKELVQNDELRTRMGIDACAHARERHSMKNADALIDLIQNCG